jgi:hypothetical protein
VFARPVPVRLSPASPWENPTGVTLGALVMDVPLAYVVLLVGWFVGRSPLRGTRHSGS